MSQKRRGELRDMGLHRLGVNVDKKTFEKLATIAKQKGASITSIIRAALAQYISRHTKP